MTVTTRLLTIGELARSSGLTSKALRHYDSVGILHPVEVDEETGYRRYAPDQVERARAIRILRRLEVPLDEIRRILDAWGSDEADARLAVHRRRVNARLTELQTVFYLLGKLIERKEIDKAMPKRPSSVAIEPGLQRSLAADLFNYTWMLLEKADRSERESELMVHAAHACRFMWDEIGEPVNHARGEWQISRVYATLGRAEPALHHAARCLEICEEDGIGDFDLAYAYEALARAHVLAGEPERARRYEEQARDAAARIAEDENRELVLSDLATIG